VLILLLAVGNIVRLKQGHQTIDIHLLQVLCGALGLIVIGEILILLNKNRIQTKENENENNHDAG
jgi:hypothetical protein|tara:strand:+ start:497 stop:691 length:195 start_codon:yes stop_codon:yes gene_type:complete